MVYDPLYIEFIYYFNVKRDYFECHEVLEELWLREGRSLLYQGLLQVAVGLYHHRNDNLGGALKLFIGALEKLDLYPPDALGIDLDKLRQESLVYREGLTAAISAASPVSYPFHDLNIAVVDPLLAEAVGLLVVNPPHKH
ncbi:MAG: DUF309 domain-containing protein [Gorillibacterium sp.]|nr:DUF309 domain-containing protein [Gorillibacterium sp.]